MNEEPKILLIEGSRSQAMQLRLVLERAGYQMRLALDGAVGWREAYNHPPRLILLALEVPTLNGFQVLSRLKRGRATAGIPVVLLTHRDRMPMARQSSAICADAYLPKEDVAHQLCEVVDHFLHPKERPAD